MVDRDHEDRTDVLTRGRPFHGADPHGLQQLVQVHADHRTPPAIRKMRCKQKPDRGKKSHQQTNVDESAMPSNPRCMHRERVFMKARPLSRDRGRAVIIAKNLSFRREIIRLRQRDNYSERGADKKVREKSERFSLPRKGIRLEDDPGRVTSRGDSPKPLPA